MAETAIEPGKYDKAKTPDVNAASDVAETKAVYEREGAEKALAHINRELDPQALALSGAKPEDIKAYNEKVAAGLKDAGILPELAIAHALQHKDKTMKDGRVDSDKLGESQFRERNPVDKALYTAMGDRYEQLKRSHGENGVTENVLKDQLGKNVDAAKERVAAGQKRTDDRANLGPLLTNPKLFDAIAGSNGEITKGEAKDFLRSYMAPGTKGEEFRQKNGGNTPEEQEATRKTVDSLVKSFDNPRNADDKPGATIVDGVFRNYVTRESLAKGMGYKDPAEAVTKLPTDTGVRPPVVSGDVAQTPPADGALPRVPLDLSNTALKRGEGPWHVAGQMMAGENFRDPNKARNDLKDALRTVFTDKEKAQQVTPENLGKLRESVNKSGNDELKTWFEKKYPKSAENAVVAAPPAAERVAEPVKDYKQSAVGKGEGPYQVAHRMAEGQGLSDNATKALQKVIAGGFTDKQGAEQISAANLEQVRERVAQTRDAELVAWFAKRYPPVVASVRGPR